MNLSGGSVSASALGINQSGGTVQISGGTISGGTGFGGGDGVVVGGGTVTLSGGSISATEFGVHFQYGTLTISGCGLTLTGDHPTGTLADGTPISTRTLRLTTSNLRNGCQNEQ